jgi:hypothetical protein
MKNILVGLFSIGVLTSIVAQEAADKKVQAGLVFGAGINMIKPGTKMITTKDAGVGSDLTVGMNLNFSFTPTIGLNTGLEFDFETIKYKPGSTSLFYFYNDTEIYRKAEYLNGDGVYNPTGTVYALTERKMKPIYLTIPTMMIFRTKFIGYFRYFGKFGLRNSFLLTSKNYDNGYLFLDPTKTNVQNDGMIPTKRDLSLYKGSVGLSGGAEWNFSGSTCLVAEIGYYYGFVDVNRGKSITGDKEKNMTNFSSFNLDNFNPTGFSALPFKQNQILFKLSILF